jgi:hypothetical protein
MSWVKGVDEAYKATEAKQMEQAKLLKELIGQRQLMSQIH